MPKLPRLGSRKILAILFKFGFYEHHTTGSHINLRHLTKLHLHVVVPSKRLIIAPKTLKSILVQAELNIEDLF